MTIALRQSASRMIRIAPIAMLTTEFVALLFCSSVNASTNDRQ